MESPPSRSTSRGLRVTNRGDLIEDIHRQARRRTIKRAVQLTLLAITLLLLGVAFKIVADRRLREQALQSTREHFQGGMQADLATAIEVLRAHRGYDPDDERMRGLVALAFAHQYAEFSTGADEARAAIAELDDPDEGVGKVAAALVAAGDGELEAAAAGVDVTDDEPLVRGEVAWLRGVLALAQDGSDPAKLETVIGELRAVLADEPRRVSLRRLLARLELQLDRGPAALEELAQARDQARSHMGLAADEAFFNAVMRQQLGGVASVADQLLEAYPQGLTLRDRSYASLARAVAHVANGEDEETLARISDAWADLPHWDTLARSLALQSAMEAGGGKTVEGWLDGSGLPAVELDIYRAWIDFERGDIMKALAELAKLPQEHPRVGYLQALALVEQRRFAEATPWIERTEKLIPDRVEIEVARARSELHTGDREVALRKLEALAKEEPRAPRAWTGYGEALLAQEGKRDLPAARAALDKAVAREAVPAEALLLLSEIRHEKRRTDSKAIPEAIELLEKAAETNPHLPRYRERLALYLADAGFRSRARELLRELVDQDGVTGEVPVRLVELEVEAGGKNVEYDQLFERAQELGADPRKLEREQARVLLAKGTTESVLAAQQKLDGLLRTDPTDVAARVLYSRTFLEQHDRDMAELALRKGFGATPEKDQGRIYLEWSYIESRVGKPKVAAPRARTAWLRMLDEDRPAWELVDAADLTTRQWQRIAKAPVAVTIAKQLTDRLPYHPEAWTIRARAELDDGEAARARQSAEKALAIDKDNPRAHELRGHCFLRFGMKDQARAAYNEAIKLVDGTPLEKQYRENLKRL